MIEHYDQGTPKTGLMKANFPLIISMVASLCRLVDWGVQQAEHICLWSKQARAELEEFRAVLLGKPAGCAAIWESRDNYTLFSYI